METKSPGFASGAFVAVSGRPTFYFFPVLRASFILSPGAYSDAPLDMPVVAPVVVGESFILSPGESSEAPRGVGEVELFIWVPGAEPEAPLVPGEPAKLKPDDPSSMAAAAITKVFFMSFSNIVQHGLRNSTLAG